MGFADQLARLKGLLSKAEGMNMLSDPSVYRLTLQQILGEAEILARKKRHEAEVIQRQIAVFEGEAAAFEQMGQIIGNLLEILIHKEEQARQEIARKTEEKASRSDVPVEPPAPPADPSDPPSDTREPPRRRGRPPRR